MVYIKKLVKNNPKLPITLFFVIVGVAFFAFLLIAWLAQDGESASVERELGPTKGYDVTITLNKQDPREPVFHGDLDLLGYTPNTSIDEITVQYTAEQGYAEHFDEEKIEKDPEILPTVKYSDFGVFSENSSHRLFPFDSASFYQIVSFEPQLEINRVRIKNYVKGFVIDDKDLEVFVENGDIHIQFKLERNPLIQLTVLVFLIATASFIGMLFLANTAEGLASAAGSFFFSLWSIRSVLQGYVLTFPTLMDSLLLTQGMILLFVLTWRLVIILENRREDSNIALTSKSSRPPDVGG